MQTHVITSVAYLYLLNEDDVRRIEDAYYYTLAQSAVQCRYIVKSQQQCVTAKNTYPPLFSLSTQP